MNTSICITIFNEEKSIKGLLESLINQTMKPDEIVIVDAGSTDDTVENIKSMMKSGSQINTQGFDPQSYGEVGGVRINLIVKKSTRAEGRNLAVKSSKNNIVAMTDAGCIAKRDWLEKITEPFIGTKEKELVVAGFYEMKTVSKLNKAMSVFLGVVDHKFDENFLPSTRSIAFTKSAWKKVDGFPEGLKDTAEDTIFNLKLVKNNVKIIRVNGARVEWIIDFSIRDFLKKIYAYAKGDAESKVWYHPTKKLASHNIKAFLVLLRYVVGIILLILSFSYELLLYCIIIGLFVYSSFAFFKVYRYGKDLKASIWGIVLQYITDLAVMGGFLSGVLSSFF